MGWLYSVVEIRVVSVALHRFKSLAGGFEFNDDEVTVEERTIHTQHDTGAALRRNAEANHTHTACAFGER